jgi:hypothetical protein
LIRLSAKGVPGTGDGSVVRPHWICGWLLPLLLLLLLCLPLSLSSIALTGLSDQSRQFLVEEPSIELQELRLLTS